MDSRIVVFLTTAREGRVTEAARLLNLSVSAASHQLAQLEKDFGTALFYRGNRGMQLTPAGETLLQYANQMEATWQKAYRDVRLKAEGDQAVRLSASHTVTEFFLPEPLGSFRTTYPDVRLELKMVNSAEVVTQVESGAVDFGISEGRIGHRHLHVTNLWSDQLGLILAKTHPWAARSHINIKDLTHADLIMREEGSGTRSVIEAALAHHGLSLDHLHVMAELASIRAILAMVANQVGVTILSTTVIRDVPGLTFIPIPDLNLTRRIHLFRRDAADGNDATDHLIQLLVRTAKRFNQTRENVP